MNRYRTVQTLLVVALASLVGLIAAVAATPRGEPKPANLPVIATKAAASIPPSSVDHRDKRKPKGGSKQGPSDEVLATIARNHAQRFAWCGTEIKPSPNAVGADWELQQEIAIAFRELDPKPGQRLKSYASFFSHTSVAVVGWKGWIEKLTPTPDGFAVEVRIIPRIEDTEGGIAVTDAYCVETWVYTGDELRYERTAKPLTSVKPLRFF